MLWTVLLIVLILALFGGGGWSYSVGHAGYYGVGGISLGFILLVVLIILLLR